MCVRAPESIALALQNARGDEDQQLAALVLHAIALEQPAEERKTMQTRSPFRRGLLLAHEDAADDSRRTVIDLHLRVGALRVDGWNAVDLTAEVRRGVLDSDSHDHGVGGRDLGRHL